MMHRRSARNIVSIVSALVLVTTAAPLTLGVPQRTSAVDVCCTNFSDCPDGYGCYAGEPCSLEAKGTCLRIPE